MPYRYRLYAAFLALQLIAILVLSSPLHAQSWQWGRKAGGPNLDLAADIGLDAAGNTYMVGTFDRKIIFNTTTLDGGSNIGLFIAKYNAGGMLQWVIQGSGTGNFVSPAIAVDGAGNSYVAGGFSGSALIGTRNIVSSGSYDMFLLRLDAAGDVKWARRGGGPEADYATGVALDSILGDCIVAGTFRSTAMIDTLALTSAGEGDLFIAKYSTIGDIKWAGSRGSAGDDNVRGIAVSQAGSTYLLGDFTGGSLFGDNSDAALYGGADVFLAKFSTAGVYQWARRLGGPGDDAAHHIAVDRGGNCFVTGTFSDRYRAGSTVLQSAGGTDIYMGKYDGTGAPLWVVQGGGPKNDSGLAVAIDELGRSYFTGMFQDSSRFADSTARDAGNGDIYVAHLNNSGQVLWLRSHGGPQKDHGSAIAVDRNGELRVAGLYSSELSFGSSVLPMSGVSDIFLAKLGTDPTITTGGISGSPFCAGVIIGVPFSITGIFGSDNVFTAQLSDSAGSFASPTVLGTVNGTGDNVITASVPLTILPGDKYRIRVISSSPVVTGDDNGNNLVFNTAPVPSITALGPLTICQGSSVTLDAGAGFTSYQWSNGAATRTIAVSQEGTYTVTVANSVGCTGTSAPVTVVTKPAPPRPTVTQIDLVLESSQAEAYQWLKDDVEIPGATARRYTVSETGNYTVRITNTEGCTSVSSSVAVAVAGIRPESVAGGVALYPQPTSGRFTLEFPAGGEGMVRIVVRDLSGREILRVDDRSSGGRYRREIDLGDASAGVYFVEIEHGERRLVRQVVKQ